MSITETTEQTPREHSVEDSTQRIADPAPLGLAAFAATTFVLSMVNAGLAPKEIEPVVLPLALFYGGLVQLLAGMWEFRKNNTFGATAFGTYGAFWLSFALFVWHFEEKVPKDDLSLAIGLFLLAFTIFTGYMMIAALRTSAALVVVFTLLLGTFGCLTIGKLSGVDSIAELGGYVGLATAFAAWYTSFAAVLNATFGRTVLPLGPIPQR